MDGLSIITALPQCKVQRVPSGTVRFALSYGPRLSTMRRTIEREFHEKGHAQGADVVRRRRLLALPAQGLHQGDGPVGRCAGAPGGRHRQHLQRLQRMPRQRAEAGRGGQARRDAGRRAADGVPDHLDPRIVRASHQHVPAQPDGDGHGRDDPRAADGRGGADRRLRQDDPGADDGVRVGRRAGDRRAGRTDAGGPLQRRATRRVHRLPSPVGRATAAGASTPRRSSASTNGSRRRPAPAW